MGETKKIGSRSVVPGWPGYIRQGKKGPVFVIEKWIGGVHFHVSTRCSTLRAAQKQLERFEADPRNYSPVGEDAVARPGDVRLTSELATAYIRWMQNRQRPASEEWVDMSRRFLKKWMKDLAGRDLRSVKLTDLKEIIERRETSKMHRTEVIKSFYGWMRKERGLIQFHADPTLSLVIPKPPPEKLRRRKVVERDRMLKVLPLLRPDVRDVLTLRLGSAMHYMEVKRFAREGEIVYQPPGSKVLAVLVVLHKSRKIMRMSLQYPEHLAAAERIRKRGKIPDYARMRLELNRACDEAGVPRFKNADIRATVLTWAFEDGATLQDVARFAEHSEATSKRFYLDLAVPNVTVPVMRLIEGGKSEKTG